MKRKGENPLLKYIRNDLPGIFNEANILRIHKERFLKVIKSDQILPPYEIIIHPSSVCNLKCEWCIGGRILESKGKSKDNCDTLPNLLSIPSNMERVIKGILEYSKNGFRVENISFSGITGEPFIAKKSFIKAINILSKHQIRTGVFSNGGLIDNDLIETILKMSYINISLDSATPKTFIKLKYNNLPEGTIIFNNIIKNISKLVRFKKKYKSNLDINVSFVLYPDNYKEIFEVAKILKKIGINNLRVKQDISRKKILSKKQKKEAVILIKKARGLEDDSFKFIIIHRINVPSDMKRKFNQCIISDLVTAIGSDGNVYPCNYQANKDSYNYGNAIEKSFKHIWEGDLRKEIKTYLPKTCPKSCDPFKNRANRLFQIIGDIYKKYGDQETERLIQEIIETDK